VSDAQVPSHPRDRWATSRRDFLRIGGTAVAGMAVFGVPACGSSSGGSDELILGATPDYESIIKPMVARYNKQHSGGPKVTVRMYPSDTGQYFDRLRTQFQAGDADLDVFAGDVSWPAQFATNGWIADLSKRFPEQEQDEFLAGAIEGDTYEDKIWGVPWFTDSGFLFFREDLLEQSGFSEPPATWDELKEMAAKVQRDADVPNGFVFTGAVYEGGTVLGTEFIRTAGGNVLDGDEVVVTSPEAVEGLRIQQTLVSDGIAPKAVANFKEDEATAAFLRGDAVFMRMWPFAYDMLGDKEASDITAEQVGLSHVPVASTDITPVNVGGGWSFYINEESGNQEAAWALVQFLAAAKQQKTMAIEGAYLPTRTALYDDPEISEKLPAIRLGKDVVEQTTTPPVSPYYSDLSAAMAKQFNANVLGSASPEDVAETLGSELTSMIERGG
jgi:multiple sugar transport system substrate-binding protein